MAHDNTQDQQNLTKYQVEAQQEYQDLLNEAPDEWDSRIDKTGCFAENMALQLCHADTNDWRQCLGEMASFKKCWEQKGNRERVGTIDR
ncbi:LAMI_0E11606g1_1 [Lachancea mirantina]|uniref:LAMI_0E11606g1_1 n=1 Tax=Lachancea mirantina TaxID=1230905 RepID=A0A1G4JPQ2_9SACH|nr:LAMI_0E11606g1_1 [Lachancea mirantina]